jgi:hypothetical protein
MVLVRDDPAALLLAQPHVRRRRFSGVLGEILWSPATQQGVSVGNTTSRWICGHLGVALALLRAVREVESRLALRRGGLDARARDAQPLVAAQRVSAPDIDAIPAIHQAAEAVLEMHPAMQARSLERAGLGALTAPERRVV